MNKDKIQLKKWSWITFVSLIVFVTLASGVLGGGGGSVYCGVNTVLVNGVCINSSWSMGFSRDRFVFNRGLVSFVALFYFNNVSTNPKNLIATVSLPYGLVNIPLSNLGSGQYGFSYDFSGVDVSSVDVLFSWDGGSRVLPLSFVDIPLFLVDNPLIYPSITNDDGRIDSQSLLVFIVLSVLFVLAVMIGIYRWVMK